MRVKALLWQAVGLVHRSGSFGYDETNIEFLPQVQVNTRDAQGLSQFVNFGAGLVYESAFTGSGTVTATRPVFGAGVGVRKPVSDGHGFVRVELRYDRLAESKKELSPFRTIVFPSIHLFSVKLGFDLVVAR